MQLASVVVGQSLKIHIVKFCQERLRYMVEEENWIDFNDQFTVNI